MSVIYYCYWFLRRALSTPSCTVICLFSGGGVLAWKDEAGRGRGLQLFLPCSRFAAKSVISCYGWGGEGGSSAFRGLFWCLVDFSAEAFMANVVGVIACSGDT